MLQTSYGKKKSNTALELMWDVKKCFEQVLPDLPWHLAGDLGYPRVLINLSLQSCLAKDTRYAGGLATLTIEPNHGIVASSVIGVLALRALQTEHKDSGLSLTACRRPYGADTSRRPYDANT